MSEILELEWYPDPFDMGGMDGRGARRLLGVPNIAPETVLVRETAQNSWDARRGESKVGFRLALRELGDSQERVLNQNILTGDVRGLPGLRSDDSRWALEITDRGTVGLGGPVRSDLTVPQGQSTNFIDFVFNLGSTKSSLAAGGTYGFGKTIAYNLSDIGTVVIWSCTEVEGVPQHRLIASAIGDRFDWEGRRYTGRHWWGIRKDGPPRVEPVIGDKARELGESLFSQHFRPGDTGTSILVLDPRMPDGPDAFAERLRDAVMWHLWPKYCGTEPTMRIAIELRGEPVPLPDPSTHPVLGGYVAALDAVRAVQAGHEPQSGVTVKEIWLQRPREMLGHLAITISRAPEHPDDAQDPPDGADGIALSSHVAYMRHSAELIVRYRTHGELANRDLQWAAVFKPIACRDDAFAQAEPPAHDDWQPSAINDPLQKRRVNVALRRIREECIEFTRLQGPEPASATTVSGAYLAGALRDLTGGSPGERATPRKTNSRPRVPNPRKPRVEAVDHRTWMTSSGLRRFGVLARVDYRPGVSINLCAHVGVAVDGGAPDRDAVTIIGWGLDEPSDRAEWHPAVTGNQIQVEPAEAVWLVAEAPAECAVDLSFEATQVDDA